jgi:hypothetical protein
MHTVLQINDEYDNLLVGMEAHQFRLQHELNTQLMKEFSLRANALKIAGTSLSSRDHIAIF